MEMYSLDHYRRVCKVNNAPQVAFDRLFELHDQVLKSLPRRSLHRKFWITFPESNQRQPVEDFVTIGIDTQKLVRMSMQSTNAGKEELKALCRKHGLEWFNIDGHKEELERMNCQDWRIAVVRFPVTEAIDPRAVQELLDCAKKHLPGIDMRYKQGSTKPTKGYYHNH